jgi:hypothetical protein
MDSTAVASYGGVSSRKSTMPSAMLSREEKISFNEKDYAVKKMALGQYAKFSEKLEELLPNKAAMLALIQGSPADRIETILSLFKAAPEKLAELTSIASGISRDEILDATPDEVLDLLETVYRINEIDKLGERVKKVLSLGNSAQA